jgi:hypothetical protein
MPVSLEALGGDVLLEVVAWLSRFDLLHFVMVVRLAHSTAIFPLQPLVGLTPKLFVVYSPRRCIP